MTLKEIALAANGVSKLQMHFFAGKDAEKTHYYDQETGLWIERGILLFRPRAKKDEAPRDILQVEG